MTEEEYHDHCNDMNGICIDCGDIKFGMTEPDAEGYKCENEECGHLAVMGIENALISGHIDIHEALAARPLKTVTAAL